MRKNNFLKITTYAAVFGLIGVIHIIPYDLSAFLIYGVNHFRTHSGLCSLNAYVGYQHAD